MSDLTVLHYLGYDNDRGGIVSVVRTLAAQQRFACVLGVNPGFQALRTPALCSLALPALAGETIGLAGFWAARRTARAVSDWLRHDAQRVFHGHSRAGLLVALWLARGGEKRLAVSVHCYGRQRWFYRHAARRLGKRLFWLTPAMRDYYGAPGIDWHQCIPACVEPVDTPTPHTLQGRPLRLSGVGTLVEWKGWHLILRALAELPVEARNQFRFRHIGGADDSDESRAYAQRLRGETRMLNLETVVEWRGLQPSAAPLLAETDALVVASVNEPCSVAMLEALQRGIPVVAADSGGACDVIRPPRNGWLFRTNDAVSLADMLRRLLEFPKERIERTDTDALERFLAPRVAEQWLSVYRQLLASRSSPLA